MTATIGDTYFRSCSAGIDKVDIDVPMEVEFNKKNKALKAPPKVSNRETILVK
jgi:hypothetical protein